VLTDAQVQKRPLLLRELLEDVRRSHPWVTPKTILDECESYGVDVVNDLNESDKLPSSPRTRSAEVTEPKGRVTTADIYAQIEAVRNQPCPTCGGPGPLDIYHSHVACSIVVYTWWKTRTHFCCRQCARKEQAKALAICILTGWWGFPWGLFVTPWQIIRNVSGLIRSADQPSDELERAVRLNFANYPVAARARARGAADFVCGQKLYLHSWGARAASDGTQPDLGIDRPQGDELPSKSQMCEVAATSVVHVFQALASEA
jgi:hypothetical protein